MRHAHAARLQSQHAGIRREAGGTGTLRKTMMGRSRGGRLAVTMEHDYGRHGLWLDNTGVLLARASAGPGKPVHGYPNVMKNLTDAKELIHSERDGES